MLQLDLFQKHKTNLKNKQTNKQTTTTILEKEFGQHYTAIE